ncbi:MAG: hypothetical protein ABIO16_13435 [Nocardioides sp.]
MPESGPQEPGRRLSRRSVARGVAWTAPIAMVAVAAPAFATSAPCQVQTNFDGLQVGTKPSVLTFLPSTITAAITWVASYGSDDTPGGTGQVAQTTTTPAWNYLECEMLSTITAGRTVTLTINLSAPVTNLGFRVHDIDKTGSTQQYGWDDYVIVNTPGKPFTYARGTKVTGTGTSADPFRNTDFGDQAIDSGLNHVDLAWAGPIQTVQIIYKAGHNGNSSNQHIGIGNVSFTDCVANPIGFGAAPPADRLAVARGSFATGASRVLLPGRDN